MKAFAVGDIIIKVAPNGNYRITASGDVKGGENEIAAAGLPQVFDKD